MVSFKLTLLVSVLIATSLCEITVREHLHDIQLLKDDVADFSLHRIFDLSKAKGKVTYQSNVGRTFNHGDPFAFKNYDILGVDTPNQIKAHDNWVIAVYDNTRIIFQAIDTDGKKFLHYQSVDLKKFGANLVCTGNAFNRKRGYMYIGCFDGKGTAAKPGSMYIFTYDFHSEQIVNEVSVKQDDGFRIVNRLEIFLESFPQEGSNDDQIYLLAYDQGHTLQKETRMSNHARVFFNIESGKLEFDTIVQVSMAGQEYDIIYDMFPYKSTLILSGRIKGVGSILTLSQCKLDLTDEKIVCNPKFKPTQIQSGTVGVDAHHMRYSELDIATKEVRYFQLSGKFTDANWNSKILNEIKNVDMPKLDEDHYWIRGIHGSQWAGVIYYGAVNHVDPGVTYLDWASNGSMWDQAKVGTVYDRDFVICGKHGGSKTMMLVRDEPLFLIEAGFHSGENFIELTAKDEDGTAFTFGKLTVLDNIFEKINIRNNIGSIDLQASSSHLFKFDHEDIIDGNGLNVEVKSSVPSLVTAVGYTQAPVRVSWTGQKNVKGNYAFAHDKVVLVDGHNSLVWGVCSEASSNPITVTCDQKGSHALGNGNKLNTKIIAQQTIVMGWSTNVNKETSTVHFMTDDGDFAHHTFKGIIHDAGFMATKTFYYAFVVFEHDRVEIWTLNKNDLHEFEKYLILDHTNMTFEHFCPTGISIPPHSDDEYDILSDCGLTGKMVLRMGLTYNVNSFNIPLSMSHTTTGFCTLRHEFVINSYKEVFSVAANDTFNYWTVPMEDLDGGFAYEMFCLPALDKIAYVAHGTKGLKNTLVVQNALSHHRHINQGRRFPTYVTGVEANTIRVYESLGRIIYVIEDAGETSFLTTFDTPRIKFNAGATQDEEDVLLTITVFNKGSEQTFLQLATVYPHA